MEVMIIRLKDNIEVISFVEGIYEDRVKVSHPHYIKFFSDTQTLGMMPYCPLSDQINFDIDIKRVEFMVLPKKIVLNKYIKMIREDVEEGSVDQSSVPRDDESCMIVIGNQTQH